jgi:hypothetical protein
MAAVVDLLPVEVKSFSRRKSSGVEYRAGQPHAGFNKKGIK